jgi:hypothetical protein
MRSDNTTYWPIHPKTLTNKICRVAPSPQPAIVILIVPYGYTYLDLYNLLVVLSMPINLALIWSKANKRAERPYEYDFLSVNTFHSALILPTRIYGHGLSEVHTC